MRLCLLPFCVVLGCSDSPGQPDSGPGGGDDVRILDAGPDADVAPDAAVNVPDATLADYTLSLSTSTGGSVEVIVESAIVGSCPEAETSEFLLSEGSLVFLSPVNETLSFCSWSGDCQGLGACGLDMDGPKAVSANFLPSDQDCP